MSTFGKGTLPSFVVGGILAVVGCGAKVGDDVIAKDVQDKVSMDPATKDSPVNVTVKDGKVTLRGTVKDAATQQRMEEIAKSTPGANGVEDQTAVAGATGPDSVPSAPAGGSGSSAGGSSSASAAPAAPAPPAAIVVPAGTEVTVTVDQKLSSKTSEAGQSFMATVAQPVTVDGRTAIPKGSSVSGKVLRAKAKGKIKGEGELAITLTSVTIRGKNYALATGSLDSTVKGKGKRTAVTTGGGAAGGALIGGLAGGGKGAGIGALVGAAGGLVGGAFTGNKQIEITAETPLTFTLSKSLTLSARGE
jgi:Predicted periplasmic or secreted lipoprotein